MKVLVVMFLVNENRPIPSVADARVFKEKKISSICPITGKRMTCPVRAATCVHSQPFEFSG